MIGSLPPRILADAPPNLTLGSVSRLWTPVNATSGPRPFTAHCALSLPPFHRWISQLSSATCWQASARHLAVKHTREKSHHWHGAWVFWGHMTETMLFTKLVLFAINLLQQKFCFPGRLGNSESTVGRRQKICLVSIVFKTFLILWACSGQKTWAFWVGCKWGSFDRTQGFFDRR